jgi:hypothetical protein
LAFKNDSTLEGFLIRLDEQPERLATAEALAPV